MSFMYVLLNFFYCPRAAHCHVRQPRSFQSKLSYRKEDGVSTMYC